MASTSCQHAGALSVGPSFNTLGELLEYRAEVNGDSLALTWADGDEQELSLTYAELYARACGIGARLSDEGRGQHVLLLYPPGVDFISGFFGCQVAGAVAVPAYAPDPRRPQRSLERLFRIIRDCRIDRVLTSESIRPMLQTVAGTIPDFGGIDLIATDSVSAESTRRWERAASAPDDTAVIQYTSGSTAKPKGVVLSHSNILANSETIRRTFDLGPERRMSSWLPPYHDMGLFGAIVEPLYAGMPVDLMSPMDFIREPRRWLTMISRSRATVSGGPNFAYDRVLRKVDASRDQELDLSSWRIAFSGSEPVRKETMEAFTERFAPCGFDPAAFLPVYGLAEATLLVTVPNLDEAPRCEEVDANELRDRGVITPARGKDAYPMMSCGRVVPEHELTIVDTENHEPCGDGRVGEIWLRGPSVACGYLDKPDDNRVLFEAMLSDGTGPFFRTGDLGFTLDGELFVTGRARDLVIIRGRNFHPQDIERVVEKAVAAARPGCVAAFQTDAVDASPTVAVVAEMSRGSDGADLEAFLVELRQSVREELGLQLDTIVLTEPGEVPKTSSGKIQRRRCAKALAAGKLTELARWDRPGTDSRTQKIDVPRERSKPTAREVERWLFERIAATTGAPVDAMTSDVDFAHFGLDSVSVSDLLSELDIWIGRAIPQHFLSEPNIGALATRVASLIGDERRAEPAKPSPGIVVPLPTETRSIAQRPLSLRAARRSEAAYDWEHASPLTYLNAPGRDLFARTDGYQSFCRSMQDDQVYSFELTRIDQREGGRVLVETTDGERRWAVDLASHDYLGLTHHPEVIQATHQAVKRYGVGASGATMLNGNTPVHRALESELADWLGKEAVSLCPSGFSMMSAVTSGLLRPSDVVFFDEYSHASLLDGIRLSGARAIRFPHNDIDALQRLLARYRTESRGAMIVTDGVCSIDGSCAPVAELVSLAREHEARLVIDDAHGLGTVGDGRGVTAGHAVDLVGGVLSKALGACGGFIAGEQRVVDYVRFFGRSACATTNVSVANAAAALASLRLLKAEPARVAELQSRVHRLRDGLRAEGVPVADAETPIVSILIGRDADAYRAWREALDLGVLAQALPFPIVPREQARIRARVSHKLDTDFIGKAAATLADASKRPRALISVPVATVPLRTLDGFESQTLPNGVRVHVRPGAAPWRVFLHPLLFSSQEAYADVLARYDTPYGIVAVDWWGHGDAGAAPAGQLSLEQMASTLTAVLEEIEVPRPCRLIGTSMGAMVGLRVAAAQPQWVASALLIGGSVDPEEGPARRFYESLLDVAAELGTAPIVDDVLTSQLSSRFRGEQPGKTESFLQRIRAVDPAGAACCIRAVLDRPAALEAAAKIRAPAVVMVGEVDLAEPVGHSERMAELIPGSTLEVLRDCGHLVPVERPEAVLDVLRRWDAEDVARTDATTPRPVSMAI